MWTEEYRWHFDYVRLAWDAGFSFEKYKYPNLDKNKICLVDVDRVVRERDLASIERFIPTVVQYILEADQAEVLDTNFVKMFRMSQLSVEYLLFCKRYLDNTVVLLKKELSKLKEENKELKLFTQDLENHISTLTQQNNLVTAFKCEKCLKAFSSEEYLYSHIKRRHSDEKSATNTETDLLQSQIKELKERLNTTEKLLQERDEKTEDKKSDVNVDENKIKVDEMQEKFEKFREKVENDLKMLQIEKNFYEDKYSKLFDLVVQSNTKESIDSNVDLVKLEETPQEMDNVVQNINSKVENTTQTDLEEQEQDIKVVKNELTGFNSVDNISLVNENFQEAIEDKINKFEENLEMKISSGLNDIQSQMEAFWGRISALESTREKLQAAQQDRPSQLLQFDESELGKQHLLPHSSEVTKTAKPDIKPRTKLSKPNRINTTKDMAQKIKKELDQMYCKGEAKNIPTPKSPVEHKSVLNVPNRPLNIMYESSVSSEPEDDSKIDSSEADFVAVNGYKNKTSTTTVDKTSSPSSKGSMKSKASLSKCREDILGEINKRLQEMGISPNWSGLPQKTFERALAIVEHKANMSKKAYPNYDSIKKSIEKSLTAKCSNKDCRKKSSPTIVPVIQQPSVINISYRRKPKEIRLEPERKPQTVTIKNRSLYEDTESEVSAPAQKSHPLPAYSAVVQELQSVQKKNSDTDSDLTSIILPKDDVKERNEVQIKSALKNYPSLASLEKKKVLFDIETDESNTQKVEGVDKEESTSVVKVDVQYTGEEEGGNGRKDGSLSDFTLSEY